MGKSTMKKKIFLTLSVVVVLGMVGWAVYYGYGKYQKKLLWEEGTKPFNTLTKIREAMNPVTGEPTDYNKKTMVVLFSSECDHCQQETDTLASHLDELENTQLWFISFEEERQALNFLMRKKMLDHPDFHLFITTPEEAKAVFGPLWLPQTFLYDGNQLKEGFLGPVKFEQISSFL